MAAFRCKHAFGTVVENAISRLSGAGLTLSHQQTNLNLHCRLLHQSCSQSRLQVNRLRAPSWSTIKPCIHQRPVLVAAPVTGVRWNSSTTEVDNVVGSGLPTDYIPEPPTLPPPEEIVECLNALGEPTIESLGLGGWWPSGLVQTALEAMHVSLGLPWWGTIALGTVFIRLCMFPLVIKAQKNAANMHNHMPTMTRLQENFSQARMSGNALEAGRAGNELMDFMKRNEVKPFKNFLVPMAQVPVFLSMFIGLRQMANLPIESMKTGGMSWFTDLTVPDPFYGLPIITMMTFLATVELGVDGVKAGAMGHGIKWFMRGMPILIFPFISNFPMAMLCYWLTSNSFSLVQVLFLKIPGIRDYFGIPPMVKHDQSALPKKKKFVEGFKSSWKNAKLAQEIEDRQRVDAMKFREAGLGPIQKTYRHDPSKTQNKPTKVISAKPKS